MQNYVEALLAEIEACEYGGANVDTIFIGGGTPSMLPAAAVGDILEAVRSKFNVISDAEITIEGNPDSLTLDKMTKYREFDINRLSIGFQSLNPEILSTLGRVHSRERALETFCAARTAGFQNINIDLIFGVPADDIVAFRETLEAVVNLGPEHISAYSLIVEEGTPLAERIKNGSLSMPDDEIDRTDYHFCVDFLAKNGYRRYEISNFAKRGKESLHNTRYWRQDEYLGFGIGAASFMGGRRFANADDFEAYCRGENSLREDIRLTREELMDEFMMLGYRMSAGPDFSEFEKRYGVSATEKYAQSLEKLRKNGLVGENLRPTEIGFDLANEIFEEFV